MLQTLRSHDQYNTTIYGLDDRYRGVKGGRRVVFVNPADIDAFGLADGDRVDLVSEFDRGDGQLQERRAKDFMVVAYSTPVGNAAAYYPETNSLVPLDHVAAKSEHAGVEGDRHPAGAPRGGLGSGGHHGPRDGAPPAARHRRRRGGAARDAGRRGAAGDPASTAAAHRHHAHPGLGCRTGARLPAHRGRHRPSRRLLTVRYCNGAGRRQRRTPTTCST